MTIETSEESPGTAPPGSPAVRNQSAVVAWQLFCVSLVLGCIALAGFHAPKGSRHWFIDPGMVALLAAPLYVILAPITLIAGIRSLFRPGHRRGVVAIGGIVLLTAAMVVVEFLGA